MCWWWNIRWRGCEGRFYNPCYRRAVVIPACASQGAGSAAGMTAQTRRLCHRAPLHCCPDPHGVIRLCANRAAVRQFVQAPPPCHSGLRAGILGSLVRGIVLPLIASPVFHPRQHLPRFACAPIGLRFGIPCKHGCAHLAPIVRVKPGMTVQKGRGKEKAVRTPCAVCVEIPARTLQSAG